MGNATKRAHQATAWSFRFRCANPRLTSGTLCCRPLELQNNTPSVIPTIHPFKVNESLSALHKFCQGRNDGICHQRVLAERPSVRMKGSRRDTCQPDFKLNGSLIPFFTGLY